MPNVAVSDSNKSKSEEANVYLDNKYQYAKLGLYVLCNVLTVIVIASLPHTS